MKRIAILLASFGFINAVAQPPSSAPKAIEITVTNFVVSRVCSPVFTDWRPVPETEFLTTDPFACILLQYRGGHKGDKLRFEWRNPFGTVMTTYSTEQSGDGGTYWYHWYLGIAGQPPSFSPGDWEVRVVWNGMGVAALPFRITNAPASALEMVSKTSPLTATVGVPHSYRFTVRGGQEPYRWTASGLPPGLTLTSDGALTGSSTKRGGFSLSVIVRDHAGNTLTRRIGFAVAPSADAHVTAAALTGSAPASGCAEGPSVREFPSTHPEIWLEFLVNGGKANDDVRVEWLDPAGDIASRTSVKQKDPPECIRRTFRLGNRTDVVPGDWRARVLSNESEIFSIPFRVTPSGITSTRDPLPGRWALLIGNSSYEHLPPIPSAAGDIELLDAVLRADGFDVTSKSSLGIREWQRTEREFLSKVRKGGTVVLYYSGYGLHEKSENWLVPVNFNPRDTTALSTRAYSVLRLRQLLEEKEVKLKIFFLNAARAAQELETKTQQPGLAATEVDSQTVISLAAPPERVQPVNADEKTSPFARMLADVFKHTNVALRPLLTTDLRGAAEATAPDAVRPVTFLKDPEEFTFAPQNATPNATTPKMFTHDRGWFKNVGNRNWEERSPDGATLHFTEQSTDVASVYLRDDSRNLNLRLPVNGGWCGVQTGPLRPGGAWNNLYKVTVGDASANVPYRVGGGVSAPSIISKTEPEYSEEARLMGYQGNVGLSLVVDDQGSTRDVRVVRSLGLGLDEKAIEAVKKWKFRPGMKEGKPVPVLANIEVSFRLLNGRPNYWSLDGIKFDVPEGTDRPGIVRAILNDLPEPLVATSIQISLDIDSQGQPQNINLEGSSTIADAVVARVREWTFRPARRDGAAVASRASIHLVYTLKPGGVIGYAQSDAVPPLTPASRIQVVGTVQQAKLIRQVSPTYPPLAKQARIVGTVRLGAIIAKDGTVESLQVISGHPLLIPAAQDAVKQWVYQPTLLNGLPVEVRTTIDVNFTLGGQLPLLSCGTDLQTEKTGKPVNLTFRNESDSEAALLWINPKGEPKPYGKVPPHQSTLRQTYEGHVWKVVNGSGTCLAFFVTGSSDAEAIIASP